MKKKLIVVLVLAAIIIISFLMPKPNPVITFTIDDGYKDNLQALEIFQKHNIAATAYITPSFINQKWSEKLVFMNWEEVEKLEQSGWEIGSHTLSHPKLSNINSTQVENELKQSKEVLEQKGFEIKSLALPYGNHNKETLTIAKKYYGSVRNSEKGLNKKPYQKYNLKSYSISGDTTLDEIKNLINKAKTKGQWLIFNLHFIRNSSKKDTWIHDYSISPENLDSLLTYIKEKEIPVKTISDNLIENIQ